MHRILLKRNNATPMNFTRYIWEKCPTPKCPKDDVHWYSDRHHGGKCKGCNQNLPGADLFDGVSYRVKYFLDTYSYA